MTTTIYGLIDPRTGLLRYIGKTIHKPRKRLKDHLSEGRRPKYQSHRARWIRLLLGQGLRPRLVVLEECRGDGSTEERFHVALARADGLRLVNTGDGGDGLPGYRPSASTKAKTSATLKALGWRPSPECRAASLRATIGVKRSPETLEKMRLRCKERGVSPASVAAIRPFKFAAGHAVTPAMRQKIAASHKGLKPSAATRKKMSELRRGKKLTDEHRQRIRDGLNRFHGNYGTNENIVENSVSG